MYKHWKLWWRATRVEMPSYTPGQTRTEEEERSWRKRAPGVVMVQRRDDEELESRRRGGEEKGWKREKESAGKGGMATPRVRWNKS
jgi:hypothetical protein